MSKTVQIKYQADTDSAVKNVEKLKDSIDDVNQEVEKSESNFDEVGGIIDGFTGGAVSGFRNVLGSVKGLSGGMKGLKGAIISTGIGALIVALGTLFVYFQNSEKGAKMLTTAGYALDGLFKVLTDRITKLFENDLVSFFDDPLQSIQNFGASIQEYVIDNSKKVIQGLGLLGEAISKLFARDFAGAMEVGKEGAVLLADGFTRLNPATALLRVQGDLLVGTLTDIAEETEKAIVKGNKLASTQIALARATAEYTVKSVELQTAIDQEQKIIDDTTRSFQERNEALDRQSELSLQLAEQIAEQARLEESALRQQLALTANFNERLELEQQLADAQASRLEAESRVTIVELENAQKRREIAQEEKDKAQELADVKKEIANTLAETQLTERDQELRAEQEKYDALKALAVQYGLDTEQIEAERQAKLGQLQDQFDQEDLEKQKELNSLKVQSAVGLANALSSVAEAFAGDNTARARKAFKISKAVGTAEALVNSFTGVTTALAGKGADGLLPFPVRLANAITAGAIGLANVAKIQKTKFQGGGSVGGSVGAIGGGAGQGQAQPSSPQVDFSFLQQGANQGSVQAFVIGQDVTNQQQADQLLQDQTRL